MKKSLFVIGVLVLLVAAFFVGYNSHQVTFDTRKGSAASINGSNSWKWPWNTALIKVINHDGTIDEIEPVSNP